MAGYIGSKAVTLSTTAADVTGNATINGDLTVKGTTVTIDSAAAQEIRLGDNDKMTFGDATGGDLQIYHDGTHSRIVDAGTGNLNLQGDNLRLKTADAVGTYLEANNGGAVTITYNSSPKLATTSTGIDVTGTVTADGLTVDGNTNGDPSLAHLYNISTGTAAEATAYITNSATKSDGLFLQQLGSSFTTVGGFVQDGSTIGSGTGASGGLSIMTRAAADMRFYTNGHTNERMRITSSGSVGIGTSSPSAPLSVTYGGGAVGAQITGNASYAQMQLSAAGANTNAYFTFGANGTGKGIIQRNSADVITIDSNHNVGIGTSSPTGGYLGTAALDVSGPVVSRGAISSHQTNAGVFQYNSNETSIRSYGATAGSGQITFSTGGGGSADTERMRITSSGNVGIGTSSPSAALDIVTSNQQVIELNSTALGAQIVFDSASTPSPWYTGIAGNSGGDFIIYQGSAGSGNITYYTSGQERMRIDSSGNLLVGTTNVNAAVSNVLGHSIKAGGLAEHSNDDVVVRMNRKGSDGSIAEFRKDGAIVGSVSVTSSGTTYNTTSDRRLKTDIQPITNATGKLMAMNPVTHKWKADPEAGAVHGFIAQEMQEIVPEAVSGDPDGEEMMSMDYGRITPVLVAALQDAMKEITALKERVAELEAN